MALFSEYISIVRNLPRMAQGDSDDNDYLDRMSAFIINYYRSKLIRQDADKGKYLSSDLYVQNLGEVELVKADINECCSPKFFTCTYRTKNPIPKAVDTSGKPLITFVGTVNGLPFTRTSFNKHRYDAFAKYTGDNPKYYITNGYLYITHPPVKNIKYINIQGVFEDPTEANEFTTCGCIGSGKDCFQGFDFEYPISSSIFDTIYKMIVQTELSSSKLLVRDDSNDTKDDQ